VGPQPKQAPLRSGALRRVVLDAGRSPSMPRQSVFQLLQHADTRTVFLVRHAQPGFP
jgi:hypothetical protein